MGGERGEDDALTHAAVQSREVRPYNQSISCDLYMCMHSLKFTARTCVPCNVGQLLNVGEIAVRHKVLQFCAKFGKTYSTRRVGQQHPKSTIIEQNKADIRNWVTCRSII